MICRYHDFYHHFQAPGIGCSDGQTSIIKSVSFKVSETRQRRDRHIVISGNKGPFFFHQKIRAVIDCYSHNPLPFPTGIFHIKLLQERRNLAGQYETCQWQKGQSHSLGEK